MMLGDLHLNYVELNMNLTSMIVSNKKNKGPTGSPVRVKIARVNMMVYQFVFLKRCTYEPRLEESEPSVITTYTIGPRYI